MARQDAINSSLAQIATAIMDVEGTVSTAIGIAYDAGVTDTRAATSAPPVTTDPAPLAAATFTQADIDAAVAAQLATDQAAQTAALAAAQTSFNAMLASLEIAEEQAVKNAFDAAIAAATGSGSGNQGSVQSSSSTSVADTSALPGSGSNI